MTLHADGQQWYSHGHAGKDAAHDQQREHIHRARLARLLLTPMSAAVQDCGWTRPPTSSTGAVAVRAHSLEEVGITGDAAAAWHSNTSERQRRVEERGDRSNFRTRGR